MITGYKTGTRYYLPSTFHKLEVHEALDQRPFPKAVFSHITLIGATPGMYRHDDYFATSLMRPRSFTHLQLHHHG